MIPISRPIIDVDEEAAVLRVLRSGHLAQGPEVDALEEEFALMCGVPHAIACANGTAALQIALLAHGIGPGDEVLIPAFTFAATANAVVACGARPVFCDVGEDDFALDVESAAGRAGRAARAVIPVHLYGQVADMERVQRLAAAHELAIIEDACQAHGAAYRGVKAGAFETAAFSLYATKNVMSGEGGLVTTRDDGVARRLRMLRNHGMARRYVHTTFGLNLRMTDLLAAIARVSLGRLAAGNARRRENAAFYSNELTGIDGLILPRELPGREHVWHQFTVRIPGRRDAVLDGLRSRGVAAEVYYPTPVHRQPAFATDGIALPVAEKLANEVLSIPVHPALTDEERSEVSKSLADVMLETR